MTNKKADIPWRERAFLPLPEAAQLLGVSAASLYRFASSGELTFTSLAGRTLVTVESVVKMIDDAPRVWKPSKRGAGARAARRRETAA